VAKTIAYIGGKSIYKKTLLLLKNVFIIAIDFHSFSLLNHFGKFIISLFKVQHFQGKKETTNILKSQKKSHFMQIILQMSNQKLIINRGKVQNLK
jgi:hypothetical protein